MFRGVVRLEYWLLEEATEDILAHHSTSETLQKEIVFRNLFVTQNKKPMIFEQEIPIFNLSSPFLIVKQIIRHFI